MSPLVAWEVGIWRDIERHPFLGVYDFPEKSGIFLDRGVNKGLYCILVATGEVWQRIFHTWCRWRSFGQKRC